MKDSEEKKSVDMPMKELVTAGLENFTSLGFPHYLLELQSLTLNSVFYMVIFLSTDQSLVTV